MVGVLPATSGRFRGAINWPSASARRQPTRVDALHASDCLARSDRHRSGLPPRTLLVADSCSNARRLRPAACGPVLVGWPLAMRRAWSIRSRARACSSRSSPHCSLPTPSCPDGRPRTSPGTTRSGFAKRSSKTCESPPHSKAGFRAGVLAPAGVGTCVERPHSQRDGRPRRGNAAIRHAQTAADRDLRARAGLAAAAWRRLAGCPFWRGTKSRACSGSRVLEESRPTVRLRTFSAAFLAEGPRMAPQPSNGSIACLQFVRNPPLD